MILHLAQIFQFPLSVNHRQHGTSSRQTDQLLMTRNIRILLCKSKKTNEDHKKSQSNESKEQIGNYNLKSPQAT